MLRVLLAASLVELQEAISGAVATDGGLALAGIAATGAQTVRLAREARPDIIVMGTRLHGSDGISVAAEIMVEHPIPVVIVVGPEDAGDPDIHRRSLASGALAVVPSPERGNPKSAVKFLASLKAMSQVKVVRRFRRAQEIAKEEPAARQGASAVVAMVASTGGPAAIRTVLAGFPSHFPMPILVVQHISDGFVEGVVEWLDSVVAMKVKIAADGEELKPGTVYFAPDGQHLGVHNRFRLLLSDADPMKGFRPSGSFLFNSVARAFGRDAVAVILTGMGDDGLEGAHAVHRTGGTVIAQDEASSVVFGMPKAAIEAGVSNLVLPLTAMAGTISSIAARRSQPGAACVGRHRMTGMGTASSTCSRTEVFGHGKSNLPT